jgi:hypothetical protein
MCRGWLVLLASAALVMAWVGALVYQVREGRSETPSPPPQPLLVDASAPAGLVPGAPFVITLTFWNTSKEPITLRGSNCRFEAERENLWGHFHLTEQRFPTPGPGDDGLIVLQPGSKKQIRIDPAWIHWQSPLDSGWLNMGMDLATVLRKSNETLRLHLQYTAEGEVWVARVKITATAPPPQR